jgi:hypothetical protein
MLKYFVICLLAFAQPAHSEIINYVSPSQQDLGTPSAPGVKTIVVEDDFMFDLDLTAAQNGDVHAMGTLANSCLNKKDYACAYQWAGTALRANYWQSIGQGDKIKNIQNEAKAHLTPEQITELDTAIREFKPK